MPVLSAVGHETDVTIADMVADVRAATPSQAAEIAVPESDRVEERLAGLSQGLVDAMEMKIDAARAQHAQFLRQVQLLKPDFKVREMRLTLDHLTDRLTERMEGALKNRRERLKLLAAALDAVSPAKRLSAGFAYVQTAKGVHVKRASALSAEDEIRIHFTDGYADAGVLRTSIQE